MCFILSLVGKAAWFFFLVVLLLGKAALLSKNVKSCLLECLWVALGFFLHDGGYPYSFVFANVDPMPKTPRVDEHFAYIHSYKYIDISILYIYKCIYR